MSIPNNENVELEIQNPNTSNLHNMEAKNKNSSSNHLKIKTLISLLTLEFEVT
jgi:hypothetical protein